MDHLDLHDKFYLSHVCRATRALTKRDWERAIGQLSDDEEVDFLVGLAFVKPNYWTCQHCCQLHRRLDSDLPGWYIRDEDYGTCPYGRGAETRKMLQSTYHEIRHSHVQQAIKLTQRPQDDKDGYLEKLLRPFERLAVSPEFLDMHLLMDLWADLRIVGGRCLSFTKCDFWVDVKEISLDNLDGLEVCSHMGSWEVKSAGPYPDSYLSRDCGVKGFMDDIHLALSTPGREVSGYCSLCVTDYVAVAVDGKLLIKRWADLGRYLSPLSRENPEFEARVSGFYYGPAEISVHHIPGSARQRYSEGWSTASERYQRHARVM
ncbi:f-box domain containing protein [Colletotrichum plurivorum]|uniref:F-box domain containing protein n=1 Tax=Colletotrichum plurivorum TaxID=2175906 RepID=A0A8H6ND87_9PEZI|nr:f-box domain containing protein [Colletotrichum plurivorum]